MRIVTLFARYGTTKYTDALKELDQFYLQYLGQINRELVVIDNSLPMSHRESLGEGRTLIGSDNRMWEFSAWDEGLAFLGWRLIDFDFVHLTTSAFGQLYTRYLDRFDVRMLSSILGRAAAVGHIDCYNEPVERFGWPCQSWLRTSFVFLPPTEIRMLGSLVSVENGDAFFSGDPVRPFRQDAPISLSYQANILGWLTGSGTGQGTTWHSRFDLTEETLPIFEAKTLAILNEHSFSVRLRTQGCATVDATWLATRLGTLGGTNCTIGAFPHWREQISQRDVDAVLV